VIGFRPRRKVGSDLIGQGLRLPIDVLLVRRRAAHHVAVHVAAGPERTELDFVDPGDGSFKIVLHHAVKLEPLPRSDPQRRISHFVAQIELR